MSESRITKKETLAYCSGMAGWSILINMTSVMLIYFYLPPKNAGLTPLIPTVTYLGIFSALALIAAGGRLFDAITDPLIAWMSDRTDNRTANSIYEGKLGSCICFLYRRFFSVEIDREPCQCDMADGNPDHVLFLSDRLFHSL